MLLSQIALYKDKEIELNNIKKRSNVDEKRSNQLNKNVNKTVSFDEDHISSIELTVNSSDAPDYDGLFDVKYGDDE